MTETTGERPKDTLLGSGSLYTLATVAPVIVTLLITPLVTRALGPEGYGVVGISISFYQFGAVLLGLGLSASITRHAIIAESGVSGAVTLVFVGTAAAFLIALIASIALPIWGRAVLGDAAPAGILVWPLISSAALSTHSLCQSVYRAVLRVKTFVALGILASFAGPGLGYLLITTVGATPSAYLAGLAAGHGLAAIAALVWLPRIERTGFSIRETMENLRIGLPTVPHSIASSFLIGCIVIVAQHTSGLATAGQIQLALFLGSAPLLVLGAFNNSWAPMVYRTPAETRPQVLSQSMRAVSVLVCVLVAGFSVLVEPVAAFVAGPAIFDRDMVDAALVAAVASPFMALYLVNIHLVFLSGRTALLAIASPTSLAAAVLVVAAGRVLGANTLWELALGLPMFHLSQWVMSTWLRRRSGHSAPRIATSAPTLAVAAVVPLAYAAFQPSPLVGTILGLIVTAALAYVNRKALLAVR